MIWRSGTAVDGGGSPVWRMSAIRLGSGRTIRTRTSATIMKPDAGQPQRRERVAVQLLAVQQRAEHRRPENRAEDGAEQHQRDAVGAPLRRVHVARRRARQERRPLAIPIRTKAANTAPQPSGDPPSRRPERLRPRPRPLPSNPAASTGTRPRRSIARPANGARAPRTRARSPAPSPSSPSMPSTSTSVIEPRRLELQHPRVRGERGGQERGVAGDRQVGHGGRVSVSGARCDSFGQ